MERECEGKVALVTGASRGIGQAIARRLASAGARVAAVSRTLRPGSGLYAGSLDETVELIRADGGEAIGVVADLSGDDDVMSGVVARAEDTFGQGVQIIVNNAAAARRFELTFPLMERDVFFDNIAVNVWAGWSLALHALPGMRREGSGWIVNISSRGASPVPGPPYKLSQVGAQALYGSTKAMVDRLSTTGAAELFDDHIAVNALAPTIPVATENARAVAGIDPTARLTEPVETMAEAALALSCCDPAEITGLVAYSLPLLVRLDRPVRTLDGHDLLDGWQPSQIDPKLLWPGYLVEPRLRR